MFQQVPPLQFFFCFKREDSFSAFVSFFFFFCRIVYNKTRLGRKHYPSIYRISSRDQIAGEELDENLLLIYKSIFLPGMQACPGYTEQRTILTSRRKKISDNCQTYFWQLLMLLSSIFNNYVWMLSSFSQRQFTSFYLDVLWLNGRLQSCSTEPRNSLMVINECFWSVL